MDARTAEFDMNSISAVIFPFTRSPLSIYLSCTFSEKIHWKLCISVIHRIHCSKMQNKMQKIYSNDLHQNRNWFHFRLPLALPPFLEFLNCELFPAYGLFLLVFAEAEALLFWAFPFFVFPSFFFPLLALQRNQNIWFKSLLIVKQKSTLDLV